MFILATLIAGMVHIENGLITYSTELFMISIAFKDGLFHVNIVATETLIDHWIAFIHPDKMF